MRFPALFRRNPERGFTLMEFLLASALLVVVISSSYFIFWLGLRVWKDSKSRGSVERQAVLALEKMGRDLRMSIHPARDNKEGRGMGDGTEIQIPSVVPVRKDGADILMYGFTAYRWDQSAKTLCRKEISASDLFQKKQPECLVIAKGVRSFKMRYLIYEGIGESYSWYDAWDQDDEAMLAVQVNLVTETAAKPNENSKTQTFQRTFFVPTGEYIQEVKEDSNETASEDSSQPEAPAA